jgi:hypothetical protein
VLGVRHLSSHLFDYGLVAHLLLLFDPIPLLILVVHSSVIPLVQVRHQVFAQEHLASLIFLLGRCHEDREATVGVSVGGLDGAEHAEGTEHVESFGSVHLGKLVGKVTVFAWVSYLRV